MDKAENIPSTGKLDAQYFLRLVLLYLGNPCQSYTVSIHGNEKLRLFFKKRIVYLPKGRLATRILERPFDQRTYRLPYMPKDFFRDRIELNR